MMRENESQSENEGKIDAVDLIIHCLTEHESKFNELLMRLEDHIDEGIDIGKLRHYGTILIEDKRGPLYANYGQIIKMSFGINGLEMSTDKGYTICFSDCDAAHRK